MSIHPFYMAFKSCPFELICQAYELVFSLHQKLEPIPSPHQVFNGKGTSHLLVIKKACSTLSAGVRPNS